MQLFYAPDINFVAGGAVGGVCVLSGEESRHAVKVLRLGVGARLHVTDGRGGLFVAEVVGADPRGCEVRVVEVCEVCERTYRLTMAVAPTKNSERFEWFLEKAVEVGVDRVVPIVCDNSERMVFKPERARRVMLSAMKQSLKFRLPVLDPLTAVREVLERPFDGVKLIAHCRASGAGCERVAVSRALPAGGDVLILIGPEGDFSAAEVELAVGRGFVPISLGDSRLRTETAALVAVTAVYLANLG
ncbi:MAG: 16S rRNA (uracil(1498)-N(3))-methyltransferase [Alistipes sp.]|jgi:16S rRNA (uracil1498-N3)-methyltransferase|nr:16S rRNA (uracil(1498)-N(3))-methyltransferase [Alistipes sp.]